MCCAMSSHNSREGQQWGIPNSMNRRADDYPGRLVANQTELTAKLRDLLAVKTATTPSRQRPWTAYQGGEVVVPSTRYFTKPADRERQPPFEFLPHVAVQKRVVSAVSNHLATATELISAQRDRDALESQWRSQQVGKDPNIAQLEEDRMQLMTTNEKLTRDIRQEKLKLMRLPEMEKLPSGESGPPLIDETPSFHTPLAASDKENDVDDDNADRTRLSNLSELTLTPDESPSTDPRTPPPAPAQSRRSLPGGVDLKLAFDPSPRPKEPLPQPSYALNTTFIALNKLNTGLNRDQYLAAVSENPPSVAMYDNTAFGDTPTIISNDTLVSNVEDDSDEIAEDLAWLRTIHEDLRTKYEEGLGEGGAQLERPSTDVDILKATARLLLTDCPTSILSSPSPYAAIVRFLGKVPQGVTFPGAPSDEVSPDDITNSPRS